MPSSQPGNDYVPLRRDRLTQALAIQIVVLTSLTAFFAVLYIGEGRRSRW